LTANCGLSCLYPSRINGTFIITSRKERGKPVTSVTKSEIPVTPPSIKVLGSKNPFNPNPAERKPRVIRKNPLMK
jgi:hypothetical protein